MSTIASHSPLYISETVTAISYWWSKGPPNGLWGIKWSRDRWRHMTRKAKLVTPSAISRFSKTAGDTI